MQRNTEKFYGHITGQRILTTFLTILVVLCVCTSGGAQTVILDVNDYQSNNIEKYLSKSAHGVNSNFFRSPENIDDPALWKLFTELQIPILRFPGGLANWYNWQNGRIETKDRKILNFMKGGGFREIPLEEMIKIAREYNIQLLYVINVYDSEEKIEGLVKVLLNSGIDIRGMEIGNEMYTNFFSDELGGPTGYLWKARRIKKILKINGYNGPVGVDIAPAWMPGQEKHVHQKYWQRWNLALKEDGLGDFDAVIVHYYPFVKKIGFSEAVRRGPIEFKNMVSDIRKSFTSKQIWVTEWNLGQPVSIPEFNSLHHAIFNLQMFAEFLKTGVELTCYHILAGRGWELLGPDRFTLNYTDSRGVKILRRVPYFAFKLFNEAYNAATKFQIGKKNNLEFIIFSTTETISIIGWSVGTEHYDIHLTTPEGFVFVSGKALRSDSLSCSNGNFTRWREDKDILPWKEKCKLTDLQQPSFAGPGIFKFDYRRSF